MENTLVIIDKDGKVVFTRTDSSVEVGDFEGLVVSIPAGKVLISVDAETKEPIFEDIPKTEIQELRDYIDELEVAMVDIVAMVESANGGGL